MTEPDTASLTGFTVAITASRRVDEFTTMLRRRGADGGDRRGHEHGPARR